MEKLKVSKGLVIDVIRGINYAIPDTNSQAFLGLPEMVGTQFFLKLKKNKDIFQKYYDKIIKELDVPKEIIEYDKKLQDIQQGALDELSSVVIADAKEEAKKITEIRKEALAKIEVLEIENKDIVVSFKEKKEKILEEEIELTCEKIKQDELPDNVVTSTLQLLVPIIDFKE